MTLNNGVVSFIELSNDDQASSSRVLFLNATNLKDNYFPIAAMYGNLVSEKVTTYSSVTHSLIAAAIFQNAQRPYLYSRQNRDPETAITPENNYPSEIRTSKRIYNVGVTSRGAWYFWTEKAQLYGVDLSRGYFERLYVPDYLSFTLSQFLETFVTIMFLTQPTVVSILPRCLSHNIEV